MSKVKEILRYVLAIILAIAIIVYVIVNIASSTLLNKNFVLDKLDETAYYTKIYAYAKENFKNYIQQSGFEESVLDEIITEEQVKKDAQKVLTNIYNNIDEEVTAEEMKSKLQENIKKQTQNMIITTEQQKSIDNFVNDICNEYLTGIAHFNFEKELFNIYTKVHKGAEIANRISLITIVITIGALIAISLNRIYKSFVFAGISCVSSGLFFIIVNMFINNKVKIQTLTILNDAFSFTLREILETIMNTIKTLGTNLLLAGLVLILIPNLIHIIIRSKQED